MIIRTILITIIIAAGIVIINYNKIYNNNDNNDNNSNNNNSHDNDDNNSNNNNNANHNKILIK